MAWQDELDIVLRVLINDVAATTYPDETLEQIIVVAGRFVAEEMTFSQPFLCDAVNVNITPDPTDTVNLTRDDSFINLVCLKSACLVERGEARTSAGQAIAIKDGTSSVDLRDIMKYRMMLLDKGFCKVYEDEKLAYVAGQTRIAGAAIMGPFRVFAGYSDVGYYPTSDGRTAYFR